jgi:uncharacterized small protein (DUF1192 family)
MVFDSFPDEPRPRTSRHEIGQDISLLSVEELGERIATLEAEIERLRQAVESKEKSRDAASALFNLG